MFLCVYIMSPVALITSDRLQNLCNTVQTAIPNTPNTFKVHYTNKLQGKIKGKVTSINTAFRVRGTG